MTDYNFNLILKGLLLLSPILFPLSTLPPLPLPLHNFKNIEALIVKVGKLVSWKVI